MEENIILSKSKDFALRIIKLYQYLCENKKEYVLSKQILRSGTSIGANAKEGTNAQSKADFNTKMYIAYKEANETEYWLEIFHDSKVLSDEEYSNMFSQCSKLRKLLIASITTAKKNAER